MRIALYLHIQKHLPTIRTLNLLALLSGLGLIYSGWQLGLLLGMINLLVMACALKLMLLRSNKDFYQLVVSLLFLIGCGFIFQTSIPFTVLYMILCLMTLLSLGYYFSPSANLANLSKRITLLCAQALPISILLFLLLPQLPPLWQTPIAKRSESGLSEKITPGDIAKLSQSSSLAFRATFNGKIPKANERYWRAIVMEDFDGKTWQIHPKRKASRAFFRQYKEELSPTLAGQFYEYTVIAETTNQPWLFALDLASPLGVASNKDIWQSRDFQLIKKQAISSQYQYQVRSYSQSLPLQPLSNLDQQYNQLQTKRSNPRTQDWVSNLRQQYPQDDAFIAALLDYFVRQNFRYTLRPNVMLVDPIDQFLFDKQAGFCSHYASALAYSLRLGGIPARIVAGYQGGELNKKDNASYLSVYQYDAHAWVEAWRGQMGWQRIDPTALIAPDRINFGLQQAMLEEGSFLADSPFSLTRFNDVALLKNLRLFLSDIDYNWSRWVLGFNNKSQQNLFRSILGKLSPQRLAVLGLAVVCIIALLLALFFMPHWLSKRLDKTQRYYRQALTLLEKSGIRRQPWQGAQAFSNYVNEQHDSKSAHIFKQLSELYLKLEYQARASEPECSSDTTSTTNKSELNLAHKMMRKYLKQLRAQLNKTKA
jgi:transglutaminase-like putative cysteine protease